MKRIVQHQFGEADVMRLEEADTPNPSDGQIVVKVHAAGINPVDQAVRVGRMKLLGEPPITIGWDLAGTVEDVAADVRDFAIGDRVFGMAAFPNAANAYSEITAVPASDMAKLPASVSYEAGGAVPLAGLTAWQGLIRHADLSAGQRVLIHAGAGGVGHLAIQIAKAKGAWVAATASADKIETARRLGADQVVDYKAEEFTDVIEPVDIVLDPLGGDHVLRSIELLKKGGRLVSLLEMADGAEEKAKERSASAMRMMVEPDRAGLQDLASMMESGELEVIVAKAFPLAEAGEAHRFLETKPIGKVVLTP